LRGTPLQMGPNFLKEVLRSLSVEDARDVLVISVIGAQSSAKSTLLNVLFGCGFATKAGRCTKGLYASILQCDDGRTLLLLDSEGLMSIEGRDHSFDAQLALMAMACSHLVVINHKGEVSRQLQELLEICLFAMKNLHVCRVQPKICFTLRDQSDRSRTVHQDALRMMRKHLHQAADGLGVQVGSMVDLDAEAIYLLPSAFASEVLPGGREVLRPTELFAEEAAGLRTKLLQWATEAANKDSSRGAVLSSLYDWYLHATSVWQVLERHGTDLLHFRSMQEIEMRKELTELVKLLARQHIDGPDGFNEEGRGIIDSAAAGLRDGRRETAQADNEVSAAVGVAKERTIQMMEAAFDARVGGGSFAPSDVEEARRQLRGPVQHAATLLCYTWNLQLQAFRNQDELRGLHLHFKAAVERVLATTGGVAAEVAKSLFATEWTSYEAAATARVEGTRRSRSDLAAEVALVFNHAAQRRRHLLHFQTLETASADAILRPRGDVLTGSAADWTGRCFRGGDPARAAADLQRKGTQVCEGLPRDFAGHGGAVALDERYAAEAMHAMNAVIASAVGRNDVATVSDYPTLLNLFHRSLRLRVFDIMATAEEARLKTQLQSLQGMRPQAEQDFIVVAQRHLGDVDRARMAATRFYESLSGWLDERLVAFAAEVRDEVLSEMPGPAGAAERAYQQSFVERNWFEVLLYVLDVNAYMQRMLRDIFAERKQMVVRRKAPQVENQFCQLGERLLDAVRSWSRTADLRFSSLQFHLERLCGNAGGEVWAILYQRFPIIADFAIEDQGKFISCFCDELSKLQDKGFDLVGRIDKAMVQQEAEVWSALRGCPSRCPCCGSKCNLVGEHSCHSCLHHVLPAFNGWRMAGSHEPNLDVCLSAENRNAAKRSGIDPSHVYPNLQEFLEAEHPDWLPFPQGGHGLLADGVLKAAWVNCRAPILRQYDMNDATPAEWIHAYDEPGRGLEVADLEKAFQALDQFRGPQNNSSRTITQIAQTPERLTSPGSPPTASTRLVGTPEPPDARSCGAPIWTQGTTHPRHIAADIGSAANGPTTAWAPRVEAIDATTVPQVALPSPQMKIRQESSDVAAGSGVDPRSARQIPYASVREEGAGRIDRMSGLPLRSEIRGNSRGRVDSHVPAGVAAVPIVSRVSPRPEQRRAEVSSMIPKPTLRRSLTPTCRTPGSREGLHRVPSGYGPPTWQPH